ncbi:uncharacterized protein LOC114148344 [Xiphophorus couchianus]|uniref:uncharacterized protein LOC114148344 n=1 Tax=Xiphophorus couchianus TaxID=32473 RepID=UPI0010164125|nr:uncharacterized protein LOC114148344 [Xiphophorus couchianus]
MCDVVDRLWRDTVKIRVVTSGQTFGAHDELLNQLERKLKLLQTDRDRSSITMLFCPITCRVGSDVEAAMSSLSGDQPVILVLMHHTRDPSYSTAGTDWADVYPNVVSSVHVLFHESVPGLLTCSQNNMAADQMLRVLSSYSSSCWRESSSWDVRRVVLISLGNLIRYHEIFMSVGCLFLQISLRRHTSRFYLCAVPVLRFIYHGSCK